MWHNFTPSLTVCVCASVCVLSLGIIQTGPPTATHFTQIRSGLKTRARGGRHTTAGFPVASAQNTKKGVPSKEDTHCLVSSDEPRLFAHSNHGLADPPHAGLPQIGCDFLLTSLESTPKTVSSRQTTYTLAQGPPPSDSQLEFR